MVTTSPLFIGGRYRKLARDVSASRWIHHRCAGRGCAGCGYAGALCSPSLEEYLAEPIVRHAEAKGVLFHGLGREDTDARMLGLGRPFVIEVHRPRRRKLQLATIEADTNRNADGSLEVFWLTEAERSDMSVLKSALAVKRYRAWVRHDGSLPIDAAERAKRLERRIDQWSPRRVMKRRGEHTHRTKQVFESTWLGEMHGRGVWEVRVESGTYVKELVSGDRGRTRPSLSSVLDVPCHCSELDVLEIDWQPPWERRAATECDS